MLLDAVCRPDLRGLIRHAGADDLSFPEFVAAYDDLVERARTGRLAADDLAGGMITLTNPGTLGTTASVPRLLAGQGTIVATGAIRRVGGQTVMTIISTYDHRVIQGAQSGLFLGTIDELLREPTGSTTTSRLPLGCPLRPRPPLRPTWRRPQPQYLARPGRRP